MTLEERQIKLENDYTNQGIADALRRWETDLAEGRLADTAGGRALTARAFGIIKEDLEEECTRSVRGLGGRYRRLLREVQYELCAVIALRAALNMLGTVRIQNGRPKTPVVQDFISNAGNAAEMEWMMQHLKTAAPGYMHRVQESMRDNRTRSQNHRRRTLLASAENVNAGDLTWSQSERDGVGRLLLESLVRCDVVSTKKVPKGRGQEWVALIPSESMDAALERMQRAVKAFTRFPPMLVPPKPHTHATLFNGASYATPAMAHLTGTVKVRTRRSDHYQWIRENIGQEVLDAANKAANVPYCIDVETAELLRQRFAQGVYNGLAGIPSLHPIEPPPYPLATDWDREDAQLQEVHAAWKALARDAYSNEMTRKGDVISFNQIMRYLKEFADDTLYFPTYFDWRGRLYFRSRINPQSADFVKAVLRFAERRPLGKRGLYWLKVHVATCYGYDKKLPEARAVWVDDNLDLIRDAVLRDIDSDFFRGADSPWCFYVAAKELLSAMLLPDPSKFESNVPVAMDATCSGMQHLSALLRDPVGGMFTNLIPNNGEEKEDIYAGVAAVAVARLQRDLENPEQARYWMDAGVPRSMAKRPVMTYVYGGTLQSCTEYVYVEMREKAMDALELYSQFNLAAYISRHLRGGIEEVVPAVAEGMRFLRGLAAKMPDNTAMQWITPAGFPVIQHYAKTEEKVIELPALGVEVTMLRFNDNELDRGKCINGIAPNFVHSLDSAHLVRVINCFDYALVPIHDSFATYPSEVDGMHWVLRNEFVDMYMQNNPLQVLIDAVPEQDIEPPRLGTLDVTRVRDSVFFMC